MIYIFQFCDFVSLATSHEGFSIKWQQKNFLHSLKFFSTVQSDSKCGEKVSIFYKWKFSDFLKKKWVYSERTFFFSPPHFGQILHQKKTLATTLMPTTI
jgi:hypothetical protein